MKKIVNIILLIVDLFFIFISFIGCNFSKITLDNRNDIGFVKTAKNTIKRVNTTTYTSISSEYVIDIPTNLTKQSNLTGIPSGTWFAYFSITPSDNSGIRWTNTTGSIYHLEYVVRGAVASYIKYEYIGGANYEWKIGTLDNNSINEIGFGSIVGGSLVNEKRDPDNPEQVVSSLEYFGYFTNWFLLNYNFDYSIDGNYATDDDIELKKLASQQFINLANTYEINNQLQAVQNYIPYKFNDSIEEEYQQYYSLGYSQGYNDGYTLGNAEGIETGYSQGFDSGYTEGIENGYSQGFDDGKEEVTENPNNYNLYNSSQYEEYGQQQYNAGENAGATANISTNWLVSLFGVMTEFANIELFPNIKLIYLPGTIIIFSFVRMLFKWFK